MRFPHFAVATLFALPQSSAAQGCAPVTWTVGQATTLWQERAHERFLKLESGLFLSSGLLLVGRTQDSLQQVRRVPGDLVARMLPSGATALRPLPVPQGDFTFTSPVLVSLGRERAILIWGERLATEEREGSIDHLSFALWSSVYSSSKWTIPVRIEVSGRKVRWGPDNRSLFRGSDGQVHLFLDPFAEAGKPSRTIHVRTNGTRWSHYEIPLDAELGATHLEGTELNGRLHLGFISSPPSDSGGRNAVFFRTHVAGREWTPQRLVFHRASSEAHTVAAAATPDGVLHLFWGQGENGFNKTALYHVSSVDGGVRWTEPHVQLISSTWDDVPMTVLPLSTGDVLALASGPGTDDLRVFRFCRGGADRPFIVRRDFIRNGSPLLLHGAHGSPVLLTSGFLVSGERVDAVWQLHTLTSKHP